MKVNSLRIIFVLIATVLLCELILRFYFGFCDNLLFKEDKACEYILKPNQNCYRFRNKLITNNYSMRSPEVNKNAAKILGFGDSVLNGGVLTDHDELATSILTKALSNILKKDIQMLNISSPSWGPDNCYAYLEKYGDFDAQMIILFVNSSDVYDNMTFNKVVDYHPAFPSKNYNIAVYELFDRYLMPRLKALFNNETYSHQQYEVANTDTSFNKGFQLFNAYTKSREIPFVMYLHADLNELKQGRYNEKGEKILSFALQNNIPVIKSLNSDLNESDYHDKTHLNAKGQSKMASMVFEYLVKNRQM